MSLRMKKHMKRMKAWGAVVVCARAMASCIRAAVVCVRAMASCTRAAAICACAVVICACAAGLSGCACGDGAGQSLSSSEEEQQNVDHIVMTYQTLGDQIPEDLDVLVERVNEISREKIGVEIELLQVSAVQSRESYPLWITQGKTMDLMLINYEDITNYVNKSMLLPLNQLLENNGNDIMSISGEGKSLFSGTTIDGTIYGVGIPSMIEGDCGAVWIPQRYLKEVQFHYEQNHIYSLEELNVLFKKLKERYPDKYPLGQICSGYNFSTSRFYIGSYDSLGSDSLTGVLDRSGQSTELMDYYETPAYYEWLCYMRQWYEAGYIYPDAATTGISGQELLVEGIVMSIPQLGTPFMYDEESCGEPMVALRTTPVMVGRDSRVGVYWTIPATSENPGAAMKFLNLMYSDEDIVNLFAWGPDEQASSDGYYSELGVYGNQRLIHSIYTDEEREAYAEFAAQAVAWEDTYDGFYFDTSSVEAQITQVQSVLGRYLKVLESGCEDLEQIYPEFIQELKAAGIDTVIEEKQRQLDAW